MIVKCLPRSHRLLSKGATGAKRFQRSISGQRGVALIAVLTIIMLGASWFFVSKLNADSGIFTAVRIDRNAEALSRAKQALIGYVVQRAATTGETNPGAFPCPEAASNFNSGTATEGTAETFCTLPAVGRLPWRTLGLDKVTDASGEPLWYVVANGWAKPSSSGNTTINSNCGASVTPAMDCWTGQLTVDANLNAAVALIIAPGPVANVSASSGCLSANQSRPTSGTVDLRNYLECENASYPPDATFVTTQTNSAFNDQTTKITAAEIIPLLEGAIASRMEKEIAPALNTVYSPSNWGLSGTNPVYPYPAVFADPTTSKMAGEAASPYRGLMPLVYSESSPGSGTPCTTGASAPRCDPYFSQWTSASISGPNIYDGTCTLLPVGVPTQINCSFNYRCTTFLIIFCVASPPAVTFTVTASASNIGRSMRTFSTLDAAQLTALTMTGVSTIAPRSMSSTPILNSDGSATVTLSGTTTDLSSGLLSDILASALCGTKCFQGSIAISIDSASPTANTTEFTTLRVFHDHSLTNAGDATTGWFVRNRWHELSYYAVAQENTASALASGPSCTPLTSCLTSCTTSCLTVSNVTSSGRSILILAGRSINGTSRSSGAPDSAVASNYLDFSNGEAATDITKPFERQSISTVTNSALKRPFNDRVIVVGTN